MTTDSLIFDWASLGPHRFPGTSEITINDETLREGIQSPSVTEPTTDEKIEILHLMEQLGIETASMGLPCAGSKQFEDAVSLCREIASARLRLRPNCGGRTVLSDVRAMAEVAQRSGMQVDAFLFIGSSPIRQIAEQWSPTDILSRSNEAIRFAVQEGLKVTYITEDTTRSSPDHLRSLLTAAIDSGAKRVCICDTAGAATFEGVMNLIEWVRELLGPDIGIDWHGHNDRGLGLANALAAIRAGATQIHATALGLGERTGNTAMEELLVNLRLLGLRQDDLQLLTKYSQTVARSFHTTIQSDAPVIGRDAFRTQAGVHAAAITKALIRGNTDLADLVYSGIPAGWVGRSQEIEVGQLSGESNVYHYLRSHGLPDEPAVVEAVLRCAKKSRRILTEDEILQAVQEATRTR